MGVQKTISMGNIGLKQHDSQYHRSKQQERLHTPFVDSNPFKFFNDFILVGKAYNVFSVNEVFFSLVCS